MWIGNYPKSRPGGKTRRKGEQWGGRKGLKCLCAIKKGRLRQRDQGGAKGKENVCRWSWEVEKSHEGSSLAVTPWGEESRGGGTVPGGGLNRIGLNWGKEKREDFCKKKRRTSREATETHQGKQRRNRK